MVVLDQDVDHVGEAGDLVNVAKGFARNYLLREGRGHVAQPDEIAEKSHVRRVIVMECIRVVEERIEMHLTDDVVTCLDMIG